MSLDVREVILLFLISIFVSLLNFLSSFMLLTISLSVILRLLTSASTDF